MEKKRLTASIDINENVLKNTLEDEIIAILMKKQCTLSKFNEVVDKVQDVYLNEATIGFIGKSIHIENQNHHQQ